MRNDRFSLVPTWREIVCLILNVDDSESPRPTVCGQTSFTMPVSVSGRAKRFGLPFGKRWESFARRRIEWVVFVFEKRFSFRLANGLQHPIDWRGEGGRGGWVGPYLSKQVNSERFAGRVGKGEGGG